MLRRESVLTSDGSSSIYLPDWDESYHSKHGAIQEAKHVFISKGLDYVLQDEVSILEIGFGTGLNALITCLEAESKKTKITYTGVEAYPVLEEHLKSLNYSEILEKETKTCFFEAIHKASWDIEVPISGYFSLCKENNKFQDIKHQGIFDLIYFDAFGYRVQPELWSQDIFEIMFKSLKSKGVLVTYAARTPIKKAMIAAGFTVEKLDGPPGKREMMRAIKS